MSTYGIPATVDTVDICETWTGSDYDYQAIAVGSSDNQAGIADTVQSVSYQNGYASGYSQDGSSVAPPSSIGATAFDMIHADNSTIQASYDDPYYGISSPDSSACTQPPCAQQSVNVGSYQTGEAGSNPAAAPGTSASPNAGPGFVKHGLSRRGVRALVDNAEEIGRSPAGNRRFRSVRGEETITRSIDPKTQLLVAEETASPNRTTHAAYKWSRGAGGYIRHRVDISTVEDIAGRRVKGTSSVVLQNVRIAGRTSAPVGVPVGH